MDALRNLRFGLRSLRRSPLTTTLIVLCLGLGIGANTAIFSVVDTILLRPLPFRDIDRLAMLTSTHADPGSEPQRLAVCPLDVAEWRKQSHGFESIDALQSVSYNLLAGNEPERVEAARVTAGWLKTMGVEPALGRGFLPEEDRPGAPARVVLVGHGLWGRRFGSDPGLVNRTIVLDGASYTVIGVLPERFQYPYQAELWTPMGLDPNALPQRTQRAIVGFGRLRPHVTLEQAQAELSTVAGRIAREFADSHSGWGADVKLMREELTGDVRPKLYALLAAVGFVLLIACANVASLLLARAQSQSRELAVRTAIGAGRRQLVQQFLTESVLLALMGGAVGVVLAVWAIKPLVALSPVATMETFFRDIQIDTPVLVFALAVSLLTGVLFGLAPALKGSRPDMHGLLNEGTGRASTGLRGRRVLSALVIAEVAVAVVLLVGAGLMLRSFARLQSVDPGFAKPEGVLTLRMTLPDSKYPQGFQKAAFLSDVLDRIKGLPGVVVLGATTDLPVNDRNNLAAFSVEGRPLAHPGELLITNNRLITPGYFPTLGIRLVEGRYFTDGDVAGAPGVAIVSSTLAKRYWPGQSALGKRVKRGAPDSAYPWLTVVGVVKDVKDYKYATEIDSTWYLPYPQHTETVWAPGVSLAIRTAADPGAVSGRAVKAIHAIDPQQPVFAIATLDQMLSDSLTQKRFSAILVGLFAALGLTLAAVGLYGVMSYSVNQRVREIGVHMALGARGNDVLRLVVRRGLVLTVVGLLIGLAGAFSLTRFLATLLYQVSPTDPATFAGISVVLTVVAFLASYLPARRATKVDPLIALRYD
jgi:putative ABC transport system permease protein